LRVLALSTEPSLAAALNMMDGWDVAFASEVEQASQSSSGVSIVLVGGGTGEGLLAVEQLRAKGVTIPAVVIGDAPAPEGARFPVVIPPFTLEELRALVEIVVRDAATKAVLRPNADAGQAAPIIEDQRAPEPTREPVQYDEPERHLRLAPDPSGLEPTVVADVERTVEQETIDQEARTPEAPPVPAASLAPPAYQTPPPQPAPERAAPKAPPIPAGAVIVGPGSGDSVKRGLLRRRQKEVAPAPEPTPTREMTTAAKLEAAADALARIEAALNELPVLADLRDLTQVLIGEVVELLSPQVAGLYLPSPEGYRVWASHGFSSVERTMVVQPHQPLFADLFQNHEAVLIEPLDLAQSLVSGIGGARTNSFIASPIEANRKSVGVMIVGGEHFENEDLDRLEALTQEAATGLAIALGLDQLRALL
jgi:hypothetical protein